MSRPTLKHSFFSLAVQQFSACIAGSTSGVDPLLRHKSKTSSLHWLYLIHLRGIMQVLKRIPQLQKLDGVPVSPEEREAVNAATA